MKLRMATLVLIALFVSSLTQAQNQASPAKSDPQSLIQIAVTVTSNAQHQSADGYVAIYIEPEKWPAGLKDSDLGPFLKLKEAKPGRSAVCLFSPSKDVAISVYFDDGAAFGITSAKANASGKIEASDITAGYKAADYFKKYPGRFISAHLSDWSTAGKVMPLGKGIVDWKEFFAAMKTGGVKNYFVEIELPLMKESAEFLRSV